MEKKINIITRGDDLGVVKGTIPAFVNSFENGIMKNASVMICSPYAKEAADVLAKKRGLCMGLHLTITSEWDNLRWRCVLSSEEIPSLYDMNGELCRTLKALYKNNPRVEDILKEAEAQLERAFQYGYDIKYVDTHMIFPLIHEEIKYELSNWCKKKGIIWGCSLYKHYPHYNSKNSTGDPVEKMIDLIKEAGEGNYLMMLHPIFEKNDVKDLEIKKSGYTSEKIANERLWDQNIFTDNRMLDFIDKNRIRIMRYDEM